MYSRYGIRWDLKYLFLILSNNNRKPKKNNDIIPKTVELRDTSETRKKSKVGPYAIPTVNLWMLLRIIVKLQTKLKKMNQIVWLEILKIAQKA